MAKYQLNPYYIEAEQFTGPESLAKIEAMCQKNNLVICWRIDDEGSLVIETVNDYKYVYAGDYVVVEGAHLMISSRERFERSHTLV